MSRREAISLWHERAGYVLRLAGWILAVSALAIPSTLTLLLPVACVLALTIKSNALALPNRL